MDRINTIFYQNLPKMATNNDIASELSNLPRVLINYPKTGTYRIFHRGITKKEWRCDVRGCRARIHSIDELIVKKSGEHSHPQEYGNDELAVVKDLLSKRRRETKDNLHVAVGEITSSLSESAKSMLPTQYALKMMYKGNVLLCLILYRSNFN